MDTEHSVNLKFTKLFKTIFLFYYIRYFFLILFWVNKIIKYNIVNLIINNNHNNESIKNIEGGIYVYTKVVVLKTMLRRGRIC